MVAKKRGVKKTRKTNSRYTTQYWIKRCKEMGGNYNILAKHVLFYAPTTVLKKLSKRRDSIGRASRKVLDWQYR